MMDKFIFRVGEGDNMEVITLDKGVKIHFGEKTFMMDHFDQQNQTATFDVYRWGTKFDNVKLQDIKDLFLHGHLVGAADKGLFLFIDHTDKKV